jgi:Beta-propeller repeat
MNRKGKSYGILLAILGILSLVTTPQLLGAGNLVPHTGSPQLQSFLNWNTFLGGGDDDWAYALAVDGNGNVYVTGYCSGSWGAPIRLYTGSDDACVAKLDSNGNLVWNTFLGGTGSDYGFGIAVDGSGNVYVTGKSNATWGTPRRLYAGAEDAFAAKLDSDGNLLWNTFLGGVGGFGLNDQGYGIAVDGSGNVYVTGYSRTTWGTPVREFTGTTASDAFVAKLDGDGYLVWNTFLGGSWFDGGYGIKVDGNGNAYVTGYTNEQTWGTPIRDFSGGIDTFVAKVDTTGGLIWNTFVGGGGIDWGYGMDRDRNGNIFVVGKSDQSWGVPVRHYSGNFDAYAAKIDASGNLIWNTFLGGNIDSGNGIGLDGNGNVYVTGYSNTTWGSPVRPYSGNDDAFAVRLDGNGNLIWNTFLGGSGGDQGFGIGADGGSNVYVTGFTSGQTWGTPIRPYTGNFDIFVAKLVGPQAKIFLPLILRQ